MIIIIIVMLVLVGFGFAVGLVASVIGAILMTLGIVSSSVVVGIRTKRPAAAIRAFLLQVGTVAGIPVGAALAWAGVLLAHFGGEGWEIVALGALGGALGGLIVALLIDFLTR